MGLSIISWYQEKVKREWKIGFLVTLIIGLICHFYKFTNYLPNHDSLYNYYNSQNVVGSGRWLLSLVCGISSYYDLPWLNGIISMIFIALTVVIIVHFFEVKNPIVIGIISGLLVCSPSVTETLFFEFTADGYMIAMFFAAAAVLFSKIDDHKMTHSILEIVLLCCTCGIYQAYISFSLILMVLYCIRLLLISNYKIRTYVKWIIKQIIIYVIALALFYVIWKVCMHVEHIEINAYQGINQMTLSISTLVSAIPSSISALLFYFVEWNVFAHNWTLYGVLNVLFLLTAAITFVMAVIKKKIYKNLDKLILMIICIIAIPFMACIWNFASPSVGYRPMMLTSLVLIYMFVAVISDELLNIKWSNLIGILLAVIVFNNLVVTNISYYYLNQEYEASYATGAEMMARIHALDADTYEVSVIGDLSEEYSLNTDERTNRVHMLTQLLESNLLYNQDHVVPFLANTFDSRYHIAGSSEKNELKAMEEVKEMGVWPSSDSIKVINNVIVIKLSEEE